MNSILEMPEIRARAVPLTVASYEEMTAQGLVAAHTELIHGFIVEKMSKSPLHARITDRLFKLIFLSAGEDVWVRSEAPVVVGDSVPEPDVSVVDGPDSRYDAQHPAGARLVVEVAVSSEAVDRRMVQTYAGGGVEEYWLVLVRAGQVECYSNPGSSGYATVRKFAKDGVVTSLARPEITVDFAAVFPREEGKY